MVIVGAIGLGQDLMTDSRTRAIELLVACDRVDHRA
jgi:hypothetical protein